jgi:hypothetical protein
MRLARIGGRSRLYNPVGFAWIGRPNQPLQRGWFVITKCVAEPGAGVCPVAVGRAAADAHDFARLGERQARERTQVNQLGAGRVLASQFLQGLVQCQQIVVGRIVQHGIEIDPNAPAPSPALLSAAIPGPIHEDSAHRLSGGGEEVGTPVPRFFRVIANEPNIRLVDQGCRLERLPRLLVSHSLSRQLAKFVVHEG